jgi:hypothetical protein
MEWNNPFWAINSILRVAEEIFYSTLFQFINTEGTLKEPRKTRVKINYPFEAYSTKRNTMHKLRKNCPTVTSK